MIMNDMLEDLEKYRILYKQTTRDMAKARQNGASSEELEEFRQKLLDLLFKIEILERQIDDNNLGGKIK